jgi:hypothetical protein
MAFCPKGCLFARDQPTHSINLMMQDNTCANLHSWWILISPKRRMSNLLRLKNLGRNPVERDIQFIAIYVEKCWGKEDLQRYTFVHRWILIDPMP